MSCVKRAFLPAIGALGLLALLTFDLPSQEVDAEYAAQNSADKEPDLAQAIIGTWRMETGSTPGSPSGISTRLKFFTGTHWCITQPDPKTGVVVFHHGGRYTIDGNTMKTTREFAGESTKSLIGGEGSYKITVDGDTFTQTDDEGTYNETWKRVTAVEPTEE